MKDRIKKYMDYKNISAGELSSLLEVQRSNISHILNGRNKPGALFIEKLLRCFPDLNARWLLTGEGEMLEMQFIKQQDKEEIEQEDKKQDIEETVSEKAETEEVVTKQESTDTVERKQEVPGTDSKEVYKREKPINKVVLLFEDGTFTDFERK